MYSQIVVGSMAHEETSLEELGKGNINYYNTHRLEYVLNKLNGAEELENDLTWSSVVWEGCTVEELLGGLIEAEQLLEREKQREENIE